MKTTILLMIFLLPLTLQAKGKLIDKPLDWIVYEVLEGATDVDYHPGLNKYFFADAGWSVPWPTQADEIASATTDGYLVEVDFNNKWKDQLIPNLEFERL